MDNNATLTQAQTDKLLQFQDLTGIEDISICQDVMQRHHWDLESAVQDQLNIREGKPSVFSDSATSVDLVTNPANQCVYTEVASLWGGGRFGFIVGYIFKVFYYPLSSLWSFARSFFIKKPMIVYEADGTREVMIYIENFEEKYGRDHPPFYQGQFGQAVNDAKRELRYLVVNLNDDSAESIKFCRETLTDASVINFFNACGAIFWSCSNTFGEGYHAMQSLKVKTYPFCAVITLQDSNKMSVVCRIEGYMSPDILKARLTHVFKLNEKHLNNARVQRIERIMTQSLRESQDEAYEASLRADKEKHQERLREEQRARDEEMERKMMENEELMRKMEWEKKKCELAALVPAEPPISSPDCLCIVFKMPSGDRAERKFLNTHTLRDMYNFVFGFPGISSELEIGTNFPKRILPCSSDITLGEAGLGKREVIFVNDLSD